MKKVFALLLIITAFAFGVTAGIAARNSAENYEPVVTAAWLTLHDSGGVYTVRAHEGHVAVFAEGMETPAFETDINVTSLREHDRKMLEDGIPTSSYEEMLMLLEDFSN